MLRKLNTLFGLLAGAVLIAVSGCGFSGKGGSLFRPDVAIGMSRVGASSGVTPGGQFKFKVGITGTDNKAVTLDQIEDITGAKLFRGNGVGATIEKPEPDLTTPATDDFVWNVPPAAVRLGTTDFAGLPPGTYVIRVRSAEDPNRSASLTVTVADATISIVKEDDSTPDNPLTLSAGDTVDLKAIVQTTTGGSTAVQFALEGTSSAGGSIDATTGLYSVPGTSTGGTDIVRASLQSNSSVFALLTINVVGARVVITPANPTVAVNATTTLTAKVLNSLNQEIHGNEVTWAVLDGTGAVDVSGTRGTVSAAGVYTAPGTGGLFRVRATSPQTGAVATVDVLVKDVRVVVSPSGASLNVNGSVDFNAQVLDANDVAIADQSVTWAAPDGGTVDANGLFTAPATPGQYRVTATSTAAGRTGTVTVLVTGNATVTISAAAPDVRIGGTKAFSAIVKDGLGNPAADQNITWSVIGGAANGSITAGGVYTAPNTAGQFQVQATNPATSASSTFTVVVTDVVVNIPELAVTLTPGQTYPFTALVSAQSDSGISQTVTWSASGGASISGSGLFTAPSAPGIYVVTATSTVVPRSDTAEVTVVAEGSVLVSEEIDAANTARHVSGLTVQMPPNAIRSFKAYLPSTIGGSVTWSKSGNGSITTAAGEVVRFNSTGTSNNNTIVLTARSVNDITKFATITIVIKTGTGGAGGTVGRPNR